MAADQVLDRIAVSTGYATLAVIDALPGQADVNVPVTAPLLLGPGDMHSLSLLVDISEHALPAEFALQMVNAARCRWSTPTRCNP